MGKAQNFLTAPRISLNSLTRLTNYSKIYTIHHSVTAQKYTRRKITNLSRHCSHLADLVQDTHDFSVISVKNFFVQQANTATAHQAQLKNNGNNITLILRPLLELLLLSETISATSLT